MNMHARLYRLWTFAAIAAMLVAMVPFGSSAIVASAQEPQPVINEFVFNHTGTDTNEFIEVFGAASTDLSAYSLLEIEGDSTSTMGVVDGVFNVGTTDSAGYWFTGFLDNELENGTVSLLLVEGWTGSAGDDLDTDDDGVLDVTPWSVLVDDVAVTDGDGGDLAYSSTILGGGFDGVPFTPGGASRIPNGADTNAIADWARNDFDGAGLPGFSGTPEDGEAINTPGSENALGTTPPPPAPELVINEIDYDQPGTDTAEFVEIKNSGDSAVDLSLVTLVLVNGSNDSVYQSFALGTGSLAPQGYFVVCGDAANVASCDLDVSPDSNLIQNGSPDAVGLLYNGDLVDAVSYEGDVAAPYTEGSGSGLEDDSTIENAGISRFPDGTDTDQNNVDFSLRCSTPGAPNAASSSDCVEAAPPDVLISEIRIDQPSTDNDEYFELAGDPGTALDGLTYLVIGDGSGGSGVIEEVTDLDGMAIPTSGFFVAAETSFTLGAADATTDLNFENSDNVTHLLVQGFSGTDGQDLDTNDDGILDATPWTGELDRIALVEEANPPSSTEYHYGPPQVGPDGSFVPGHAYRCGTDWEIGSFDPVAGDDTPGAANACGPAGPPPVLINEIRIDQSGSDDDEYFELLGNPGTSLDGLTYLVIGDGTGGSGVIENVTDLSGQAFGASEFFVAAESTFTLGTADMTTPLNFENSDNVTHLLVQGFSGTDGQDLDTNDDGILDSTPWTAELDRIALVEEANPPTDTEYHYGPPQVGPDGSFVPGQVYRCELEWRIGSFAPIGATDTPGAANPCESVVVITKIHDVQGAGMASPIQGSTVTIEGIVVGDYQDTVGTNGDLNGFFVQEEDADVDANPLTSEGIFVYNGSSPSVDVHVGDLVRVEGGVSEFNDLTELSSFSGVTVVSSGNPLPTAASLSLPVTAEDDFEAYEGMRVFFPQALVISEYFNFDRFGEIVLTGHRHMTPTAEFEPGAAAIAAAEAYALDRITLDDGRSAQNPDPALHPAGGIFDLGHRFRGGDTVSDLTGVMHYDFGLYRIQPTDGGTYHEANPRPVSPPDVGGGLKVASFNVLNYFTTLDNAGPICGPAGDQDCRGADDANELERQRAKILSALQTIDADVFGLMEIQNDGDDASVADLVAGLNATLGAGTYDYIPTGYIGTDAIKVALIYKPASVMPAGSYAILDSTVDPRFIDTKNRPALAQSFQDNTTGGVFTVAVNHLKSKGSPCDDVGDPDTGDGQGNCNLTRKAAAEALVDWLSADPTGSGSPYMLIMGDLNAYDHEDPIDAIKAGSDDTAGTEDDWTDLVFQYQGEYAYSYVFDGQIGYLDSALASAETVDQVTGTTIWHINADEPDILDYDTSFKKDAQDALFEPNAYRSSDHDPVIVGLDVCEMVAPTLEVSVSPDTLWPADHKYVDVTAVLTANDNWDTDPTVTLVSVVSNEPDDGLGDGDTANDIVIVDDTHFQLRAERSGTGEGRVYTITYMVTDDCGNSTTVSVDVTVPKSQGKAKGEGK